MGLFKKLLETKYCSICNDEVPFMGYIKLRDGNCCLNCKAKLSPYFTEIKTSTTENIKYQIECRNQNVEKLRNFKVTRTMGFLTKILIDEDSAQFIVTSSKNFKNTNTDVIDFSSITNCFVDIVEKKTEIKYQDSNGETKSFSPQSFAYSYDFFIEISLSVPYIETIRFKINDRPIDNDQITLIKMSGGIFSNIADMLLPARSNNGITSNALEVQSSASYKKYEQVANDIHKTLMSYRATNKPSFYHSNSQKCPWCGSKLEYDNQRICKNCGGLLDN